MIFSIFYGTIDNQTDVTDIAIKKCVTDNILTIPNSDAARSAIFGDPLPGVLKHVFMKNNETSYISVIDASQEIKLNVIENNITKNIVTNNVINEPQPPNNPDSIAMQKLHQIHQLLQLDHGSFDDELPEQIMTVTYLKGHEKVLEIGANVGRNSLIIAHILKACGNNNFVTLESDAEIAKQLEDNRNTNNFNFAIENSALSKRNLIQTGWNTIVGDEVLDGYKKVNTITLDELRRKYKIDFDTLVLDCEGAFYYILMDMPEILDGINLIIMENDYTDLERKKYIDGVLIAQGFTIDYTRSAGWATFIKTCYENFYEVWIRKPVEKLTVISHVYNEEYLIPFWLKHTARIFDHGIIVDYCSTDRTREIIKEMCPTWEVITTKNLNADGSPNYHPELADLEINEIEKTIQGYKVCLTATEFLMFQTSKQQFIQSLKMGLYYHIHSFTVMTEKDNNYPRDTKEFFDDMTLVDDAYYRGHRILHSDPMLNYCIGRHWHNGGTPETNLYCQNCFLLFIRCYPNNVEMYKRKIQIQRNIPKAAMDVGLATYHKTTMEGLVNLYKEEYAKMKDITKYNPFIYETIQYNSRMLQTDK